MKSKQNKIFITGGAALVIMFAIFVFANIFGYDASGNSQNYYSGDAVSYKGDIFIASANSGKLEIFKQQGSDIIPILVNASDMQGYDTFFDVALSVEDNSLYAYATNGRYIVKYDASNPKALKLLKAVNHNDWDWFSNLEMSGDYLVSNGSQGMKMWNKNLQTVNAQLVLSKQSKVGLSPSGSLLYDVRVDEGGDEENDFINIIDLSTRQTIVNKQIVLLKKNINRGIYHNTFKNMVYVPGDRVLKSINLDTKEVKNFSHDSNEGFSAVGMSGANYLYFSNGSKVFKLDTGLNKIKDVAVSEFNMPISWAMEMKLLNVNGSERLVVFNNSGVVVLDSNLNLVASYKSKEEASEKIPEITDPLAIALNTYRIAKGKNINVAGAGFGPSEGIEITFQKQGKAVGGVFTTTTDKTGKFRVDATVPSEYRKSLISKFPEKIDVRAEGTISKKHISTAVTITE